MRRCGLPKRKINELPVRQAVSSNPVGSLTIMKTCGGHSDENRKTTETVLVFYERAAYSEAWQE
jgi:hypothetical protein